MFTDRRRPERLLQVYRQPEGPPGIRRFQHREPDQDAEAWRARGRSHSGTPPGPDEPQDGRPQPGEERHHGRGGRDAEHGVHRQHQRHPRRSAGEPQHAALLGHHAERDRQHHEEVHEESEGDRDRQQERRKQEHPRYLLYGTGTRQVPGSETHRRLLPEHLRHRLLPYPQRDAGDRRQTDTGRLQRRLAARRTEPGAARLRDAEVPRQKHPTLSCYRCSCPRPGCGRSDTRDQLRPAR